jgi:hypothetical protein
MRTGPKVEEGEGLISYEFTKTFGKGGLPPRILFPAINAVKWGKNIQLYI